MTTQKRNEYAIKISKNMHISEEVESDMNLLIEAAYADGKISKYQRIAFYNNITDASNLLAVAKRILYSIVDGIIAPDEA